LVPICNTVRVFGVVCDRESSWHHPQSVGVTIGTEGSSIGFIIELVAAF
jgi:hypothetical protein